MKKQSFSINANLESKHSVSTQSLCTWSLQYVLHLLHIIFKFTIHAWQVPRSSVGRALYRECGPSQDRNPVPGDLPFCFLFLFFFPFFFLRIFFLKPRCYSHVIPGQKNSLEYLCVLLFSLNYLSQGFLPLICKFTFLKCTLKLRTCIGTLLNLSIFKSNNKALFSNANLESKHSVFHTISVNFFLAVRTLLVTHNL